MTPVVKHENRIRTNGTDPIELNVSAEPLKLLDVQLLLQAEEDQVM